jgi:ATP-dependent exoDNAse (exonuclease V) alpha subunit
MPAKETIKGATLERILFPKSPDPDNSYMIGRFLVDEDDFYPFGDFDFTGMGNCSEPEIGLKYTLVGRWKENRYRGKVEKQLHFESAILERPRDEYGIRIFLSKRFKGIGMTRAKQIVTAWGTDAIDILRDNPARGEKEFTFLAGGLAEKISDDLKNMDAQERILIELEKIFAGIKGLPRDLVNRLWDLKKAEAPAWIRENPYRLTDFRGVGFLLADQVAMSSIKISADSIFRKKAAAKHALAEYQRSTGSVWILKDQLAIHAMALIGIDCGAGISGLIDDGILYEENK